MKGLRMRGGGMRRIFFVAVVLVVAVNGRYIRGYGVPKYDISSKKSITEIAKEVISGKWGNGDDRKKKLTAAGYDYTAVQKEVNRLLKYVGDVRFQKKLARDIITGEIDELQACRYIKNHHKGIIDRSAWDRTQRKLENRKKR